MGTSSNTKPDDSENETTQSDAANPDSGDSTPAKESRKFDRSNQQWIKDRVNGDSKYGDKHPPLGCCRVPPCVAMCPCLLEQNCLCEFQGSLGLVDPDNLKARHRLMMIGLASNLIGMALTIVSCFAISTKYDILSAISFTSGTVTGDNIQTISIEVGLRGAAIDNPNPTFVEDPSVLSFDEFCDAVDNGLERYFDPAECDRCNEFSTEMVATLLTSLVTYLPTIFTDILRMYPAYDVNCQKAFGAFVPIFSLAMSLNTLLTYQNECFDNFNDGTVPYTRNGTVVEDGDEIFFYANFDWKAGAGFICLAVATGLKLVDITCHAILPVPKIARDHKEQAEYEDL